MAYPTKISVTLRKGVSPKSGVEVSAEKGLSLEQAEKKAKGNQKVNFFTRSSATDETVFYGGDFGELQAKIGTDTYIITELVDTSDDKTITKLLSSIGDSFTSKDKPMKWFPKTGSDVKVLKAGLAFCTFSDVQADLRSIPKHIDALFGGKLGKSSEFDKFISAISNNTREISFDFVKPTIGRKIDWFKMPFRHNEPRRNELYGHVMKELDRRVEFDDDLSFVLIAFPDSDLIPNSKGSTYEKQGFVWLKTSECIGGQIVDKPKDQKMSFVVIDPGGYSDKETHTITIHEIMHALSLPDLYGNQRSFKWTVMGSRTYLNLTNLEKLALGWLDLDKVCFLVRGFLVEEALSVNGKGMMSVVIMPQENARDDFYFIEVAQTNDIDQQGLLLLVMTKDPVYGKVMPFVHDRGDPISKLRNPSEKQDDPANQEMNEGGVRAAFGAGTSLDTSGVFAHSIQKTGSGFKATIGVDRGFELATSASILRETESIVSVDGMDKFSLSPIGQPLLSGSPELRLIDYNQNKTKTRDIVFASDNYRSKNPSSSPEKLELSGRGYGFCFYVDDEGQMHLAAATKKLSSGTAWPNSKNYFILKTFGKKGPKSDDYEFKIQSKGSTAYLTVFSKKLKTEYNLFETENRAKTKLPIQQDEFLIEFYEGDGNLLFFRKNEKTSRKDLIGETKNGWGSIKNSELFFDNEQGLCWRDKNGAVVRRISGAHSQNGPLKLKVIKDTTETWSLYVVDKNGTLVFPVMGKFIKSEWKLEKNGYKVSYAGLTGKFEVTEPNKNTKQYTIGTLKAGHFLSFDKNGALSWRGIDLAIEKTIYGKKGQGPFFFDIIEKYKGSRWSLVVKSQNGEILYSIVNSDNTPDFIEKNDHFRHVAVAKNTNKHRTLIDHHELNGNPGAVVLVTQSFGDKYVYNNSDVGMVYDNDKGKWSIFNCNGSNIPVNAKFNVLWSEPSNDNFVFETEYEMFYHEKLYPNRTRKPGTLSELRLRFQPWRGIYRPNSNSNNAKIGLSDNNMVIFATHGNEVTYRKDHKRGVAVGIRYKIWVLFQQDMDSQIVAKQKFNLMIKQSSHLVDTAVTRHKTTKSNCKFNYTEIDNPLSNGNPDAFIIVTPVWNERNQKTAIGVFYLAATQRWNIFNQVSENQTSGDASFKMEYDLEFNAYIRK